MDSTKSDPNGDKLEHDTAQNTQKDPKLSASLSSSSNSSAEDLFQLNPNPNEHDTKKDTTILKMPGKPPLSSQPSMTHKFENRYDPNRIPAEIFKSKPAEWSVTSNESLFSIQIGNNSYLNSPSNYSPLPHSGSLGHLEMEPGASSGDSKRSTGKSVVFVLDEDVAKQRESTSGVSVDGSVASHQSFAFPILTTGEGKASKNELETKSTPKQESQSHPLTPPSEIQKDGTSDQQPKENINTNTNCFSWLLPFCRGN